MNIFDTLYYTERMCKVHMYLFSEAVDYHVTKTRKVSTTVVVTVDNETSFEYPRLEFVIDIRKYIILYLAMIHSKQCCIRLCTCPSVDRLFIFIVYLFVCRFTSYLQTMLFVTITCNLIVKKYRTETHNYQSLTSTIS